MRCGEDFVVEGNGRCILVLSLVVCDVSSYRSIKHYGLSVIDASIVVDAGNPVDITEVAKWDSRLVVILELLECAVL